MGGTGLALVAVVFALLVPGIVQAHAFLVSSSPAAGQHLHSSPPALRLRFTEAIAATGGDHLTVQTEAGHPVPLHRLRLASGGTILVASLPHLGSGVYLVHWQVVSADDGHPSAGEFAFAVGDAASLTGFSRNAEAPIDWLAAVVGWLFLLGLALATGGLMSELIIWRPLARGQLWAAPRQLILPPLLLALAGGLGLLLLLAGSLDPHGATTAFTPPAWMLALHTRAGITLALALFFVLYALAALPLRPARAGALVALLAGSGATALRTHPAATTGWWAAPAIVLHVVLALLWTGMLAQLVLVVWRHRGTVPRQALLAAVRRYADLALWSVSLILVSGLVTALVELSAPGQLVTTPYGRVLLIKGALVLIAVCFALTGRVVLSDDESGAALSRLRVVTRPEALTAIAVLALASLLSNIAPPYAPPKASAAAANALLGPPPPVGPALTLASKAGWLEVYVTASRNQLTTRIVAPNDETPQAVRLRLSAQPPGPSRSVDLFPPGCGSGCFSMRFPWRPGTTRLTMDVTSKTWAGGSLSLAVPWPPLPVDPHLLPRLIAAMHGERVIVVTERTSSSPGASFVHTFRISGSQFVAAEPYAAHVPGIRPLPSQGGLRQDILYLSGSEIWVHLWIDDQDHIRREVIVDPGHLIERTFSYSAGS